MKLIKMKKNLLLLGSMFFCLFSLHAQITIGIDQIPAIGDSLFYQNSIDVTGLEIGDAGANQVWDYSNLVGGIENSEFYIDPSIDTTGLFTDATIAFTGPGGLTTQFAEVTDTEVRALGLVSSNFMGFGVEIALDPTQKLYEIPTNYTDNYISDYEFVLGLSDPQPGVDTARVLSTSQDIVEIDAYGTLRLPQGDFEVLRRKVETTTYLSIEAFVIFFWQPVLQDTTITTSYDFYARESKRELARVTMDSLGNNIVSIAWQNVDAMPAMAPVASFSHEQSTTVPSQIDFTDESSNSPVSWSWDFGDGGSSNEQHPMHIYDMAGDYTVCLTAGNSGGSNQTCQTVSVNDTPIAPVAAFTYSISTSVIGRLDFEDQSTNTPTSWLWDFGDGTTSTLQNPNHVYGVEADYEICLFATNDGGTSQTCQTVFVEVDLPIPTAAFTYQDTSSTPGLVHFENLSSNLPTEFLWDFGDGTTSTEINPIHTFPTDDTYNVCLTASNTFGSDQTCEMLFVNVGNQNIAWNPEWQIGPNPNQGSLFININNDFVPDVSVRIYSALGQLLYETDLVNNELININHLSTGNYWLSLIKENEILGTTKLQIVK